MKFEGTKGQWISRKDDAGFFIEIKDATPEKQGALARVYNTNSLVKSEKEAKSNLALICAAPELLKALQNTTTLMEACYKRLGFSVTELQTYNDAIAAINKALTIK